MVYLNYWYTISLGIKCMQYKLQYVEDMLSFTWNMLKIFNPLRSQCKKNSRRMSQYVHRMFVSLPLSSDIDTVFQKKYNLAWIWLTMGQIPIQYDPQRATKRKSQWSKFPTWLISPIWQSITRHHRQERSDSPTRLPFYIAQQTFKTNLI